MFRGYLIHLYLQDILDMNAYIITEDRNFKILLKENYAIAFDSRYLCTKL